MGHLFALDMDVRRILRGLEVEANCKIDGDTLITPEIGIS
jgi:hypothetical protein